MLLIPPVLLKLGSTGYRFARYYAGDPSYARKGPPALPMRVLAPGVVLTTLALFGTGVALLLAEPDGNGTVKFLHKASFIAWFGLMAIHVLGHLLELPSLAAPTGGATAAARRPWRAPACGIALLGTSLVAGLVLALATISLAGPWLSAQVGG